MTAETTELNLHPMKALLGIPEEDTGQDGILQFLLNDVKETITNYCNLRQLPSGLEHTAYRMAVDLYRAEAMGTKETPQAVASVTVGGTSTSFQNTSEQLKGTLLKNYQAQLNRYRKLRWNP